MNAAVRGKTEVEDRRRAAARSGRTSLVFPVALVVALMVPAGGCRPRRVGPNDAYLDPRVGAEKWDELFRGEDREVYEKRDAVVKLVSAKPGTSVADIGAGTGVFSMLLSDAVGPTGRVYAEEVMLKFSAFIAERAARENRRNVVSVVGTERDIGLPTGSVDLAFLCDVYHHFDDASDMLASIHRVLRDGGEVVLVEFRREPGRSPPWIFEHVRAGEEVVVAEFERAGFASVSRDDSFRDNYVRRFQRMPVDRATDASSVRNFPESNTPRSP